MCDMSDMSDMSPRPVRHDLVQVHRGGDHLDVRQPKLRALRHQSPVDGDAGTPVKVQPASVTAPLVGIQVDAPRLR